MGSVVTVAELMRRCSPAPETGDDDGASDPGRRAAAPRGPQRRRAARRAGARRRRDPVDPARAAAAPAPRRDGGGRAARRGLGLRAHGGHERPVGAADLVGDVPRPGRGRAARAPPTVLDAGVAAPASWLPVAFPTLFPGGRARRPPLRRRPAGRSPSPRRRGRRAAARRRARPNSAPAPTSARAAPRPRRTTASVVGDTVDAVGGTVQDVGEDTPLKDVTDTARRHGLRRRPPGGRDHRPDHRPDHGARSPGR